MSDKLLVCHTPMYDGENSILTKGKEYTVHWESVEDFGIVNDEGQEHFFNKQKDEEGESYLDWFNPVRMHDDFLFEITCKVCDKHIGYSETDDNGNAMCLDCYYK